ncbi:putative disease resistance protein RGA3 [Tasmannia lanceolata]|uniref:putative disease resistance protein RGA3 n=1 Tax=Tasmannia lanceolata TaxID=3420 RepID=UPI004063CF8E
METIIKRIGGIPLVAKGMGTHSYMLAAETNMMYPYGMIAETSMKNAFRMNAFRMSLNFLSSTYEGLHSHLKACFDYFSLFPREFWLDKETLIQLWMAHDLIRIEQSRAMEEIGAQYFDDLISGTSFFRDTERDDDGNIIRCKLHDLVYDLSLLVRDEEHHLLVVKDESENTPSIPTLQEKNILRTLFHFGKLEAPRNFFSQFLLLRAIDFSSSNITKLPNSVGKLKHLRFLNMSCTYIKKLPKSICNLHSLQTLKLSFSLLVELPTDLWKLLSLRHLEIECTHMDYMPNGMGRLRSIRNLSEFIIGGENACSITELGDLNLLQGSLIISNLNRLTTKDEAMQANLNNKDHLTSLILDCKKHFCFKRMNGKKNFEHLYRQSTDSEASNENEVSMVEDVFQGIQPHENLRRLEIWNYVGCNFPIWLVASLSNLVSLELVKCDKVEHLPSLGKLRSLKYLRISEMSNVKYMGREFYGEGEVRGFLKLERFTLEKMSSLEDWDLQVLEGEMALLRELRLQDCPRLKALPESEIPLLRELVLKDCPRLNALPCLPNTLWSLHVCNCTLIAWNPCIPMLHSLVLKCKEWRLPLLPNLPKLVELKIMLSPELTSLPQGLGQLKDLQRLTIHFCPKVKSLPHELQQLVALQELSITACPLLTKRCQRQRGEDWAKIAHISHVEIDLE